MFYFRLKKKMVAIYYFSPIVCLNWENAKKFRRDKIENHVTHSIWFQCNVDKYV